MSDRDGFAAELAETVRAGRTFGAHPLWKAIEEGRLPLEDLRVFASQFFLQVVEFPRAVSALHSRCSDRAERIALAESVYEEETGRLSGTKPHPALFLDFCEAIGLDRSAVPGTEPFPATASLIHWFGYATRILSFLEGVAAIQVAAEGQVVGAFGPFARGLQEHYDLSEEAVAFWDVHEMADAEHSDVGDSIVVRGSGSDAQRDRVRRAVGTSLQMWWQLFDGIAAGCSSSPLPGITTAFRS